MTHQGRRPRRKGMRLRHHDYANPGYYFFTAVAHDRACRFGCIHGGEMLCNAAGHAVMQAWTNLPKHYPHARLDEFVVMPNHVHGIIGLGAASAPHGLPELVRALKTYSARSINRAQAATGRPAWQRGYYERVLRNIDELERAREYVSLNPVKWELDRENID